MTLQEILSAVFTFALGLLAKFIYDIWSDQRKRKSLIFVKTFLASFTINTLDDDIRKQLMVLYGGLSINSIHRIRIEVENNGVSAVKNQAFTVKFTDKAQIIGEPHESGKSEDHLHSEIDLQAQKVNSRRFIINYLRQNRRLAWDFTVINHESNDFIVEHGFIKPKEGDKEIDLDVASTITSERTQLDLAGRISRIATLLIYVVIVTLVSQTVSLESLGYFDIAVTGTLVQDTIKLIAMLVLIWLWLLILQDVRKVVLPFLSWLRSEGNILGDTIHVSVGEGASDIVIGKGIEQTVTHYPIELTEEAQQVQNS